MKALLLAALSSALLLFGSDTLTPPQPSDPVTDLLGGRITVRLPRDAKLTGAWTDLMGAAPADTEISRIQLDAGSQRMVLVAYELFARAGDDFGSVVRKQVRALPTTVTVEDWKGPAPLRGYAYFPTAPIQDQQANLIMGLYVALPDQTVEHLVFLANKVVAQDFVSAKLLAVSIANTLGVGSRTLTTAAGEYPLFTFSSAAIGAAILTHGAPVTQSALADHSSDTIFVSVPEGYVATEEVGIDFSINRVRKVTAFGELTPGILVYVGDHPPRPEGSKQGTVLLLGVETQWYEKTITGKDGQNSLRDSALVTPSWSRTSQVEVSLQAKDRAGIDELKKLVGTLRIGKSK